MPRKKGSKNRKTQELDQLCADLDCDPFQILILFAKGDWKALGYEKLGQTVHTAGGGSYWEFTIKPEARLQAATQACSFLYPKRKAVEMSLAAAHSGTMTLNLGWGDEDEPQPKAEAQDAAAKKDSPKPKPV